MIDIVKLQILLDEAKEHFEKGEMGIGLAMIINDLEELIKQN